MRYPNILIAASANGGARNPKEAANMKREGVCPGWPDIHILNACRGYHGLFIELKAPKTATSAAGRLSIVQKNVLQKLNDAGYYAIASWGWLEAKEIVEWYLDD